jgi:hypothetical protein
VSETALILQEIFVAASAASQTLDALLHQTDSSVIVSDSAAKASTLPEMPLIHFLF